MTTRSLSHRDSFQLDSQVSVRPQSPAVASPFQRFTDGLARFQTIMKESPLTVIGLSTKRSPTISEIIQQTKVLCEDYIFCRLVRSGLLAEGSSYSADTARSNMSDVSRELQLIGARLETMYPNLYQNVSRQVNITLKTEVNARRIVTSVGDFLFKHGVVTWCRVISLLAVAAAVATECCQAGHTQLIPAIVAAVTDVVERHAASWISLQGGWAEVLKSYRVNKATRYLWALTALGLLTGFIFTWVTAMQI